MNFSLVWVILIITYHCMLGDEYYNYISTIYLGIHFSLGILFVDILHKMKVKNFNGSQKSTHTM